MNKLEADQKAEAMGHLKDAVFHLASCWDALYQLESILETEVETSDIQFLAGGLGPAEEVYKILREDDFDAFLEEKSLVIQNENPSLHTPRKALRDGRAGRRDRSV